MNDNVLKTLRVILLIAAFGLLALFGYRYFARGVLDYYSITPIFALLMIYIITTPKAK